MAAQNSDRSVRALLATQFCGAVNDNIYKLVISLLVVNQAVAMHSNGESKLSMINICFVGPFILFSPLAGSLSDRFSKTRVMQAAKLFELLVLIAAYYFLANGALTVLTLLLFLMGIHSAIFSPAKYGILPELLDDHELSKGNGYLEFWTFAAIIVGTGLGGLLTSVESLRNVLPGLVLIGIASAGLCFSFFIRAVPPANRDAAFNWNPLTVVPLLKEISRRRDLFLVLLAIAYFWSVAALFQLDILLYAKELAGLNDLMTSILLAVLGVGIGAGSVAAGTVSEGKVELGLVPVGAALIAVTSMLLKFSYASFFLTALLLLALGFGSGLFIVPLNSYFQQQSPAQSRGSYIGASNVVAYIGMLLASGILFVCTSVLNLSPATILLLVGIFSLGVTAYICKLMPEMMLRCLNWVVTHTLYRVRVVGRENLPTTGGALLICNHVAYVDPMLLLATTGRPIRFLVYRPIYESKFVNPVARMTGAIPLSATDSPKDLLRSFAQAREALERGELVCIFAEGELTRIGHLLSFKKGFERIVKGTTVPVIPVYIDQIWGSIFSHRDGKLFWKIPKQLPYPVSIAFGKPLAAGASSHQARQAVQELSADLAATRHEAYPSLHSSFVNFAKKQPFRTAVVDSTGARFSYLRLMISAMCMSEQLRSMLDGRPMVGVMLPASAPGAIANLALTMSGHIPVNLNFTVAEDSLQSAIKQCSIEKVLTSREFLNKLGIQPPATPIYLEDLVPQIGRLSKIKYGAISLFCPHKLIDRFVLRSTAKRNDVATVIFSSGSTGEPKGVMLSHGNIASNVQGLQEVFQIKRDDCIVGVLPFFHSFGFTATIWLPLLTGTKVVYHPNPTDATTIGSLVQSESATILLTTPTFLLSYIRRCSKESFQTLRFVMVGAEKLKERVASAFNDKFGIVPMEGYGCTELSPVAILNVPDFQDPNVQQIGNKPGSVGHPLPGVAVRIVDPETLEQLPIGQAGLLIVRGPNVMLGYLGNADKTREVVRDGWYLTGDIASMDHDGFVTITDRMSRFSKIGGEMVPHIKIEEAIQRAVGDVETQCVVTAVPDEKKGEKLLVLSNKQIDIDVINRKLSEEGLPNLWIPKKENYYTVENIPLLGSGKLDLKSIKQLGINLANV